MHPKMDILHAMMVRSGPQEIYRALTEPEGLSAWFGPECRAEPRVGSPVEVMFHDRHNYSLEFEVIDLEPGARVVWKVIRAIPGWDDFPSTVAWTLILHESSTIVELRHSGWPDGHEAYPSVSFKWAEFMIALRVYVQGRKHGSLR
jgi:uncharacterized protein YndB with AHSA1/START domain